MYRVFLGAPTRSFLSENNSEDATFGWRTVSSLVEDKSTVTDPATTRTSRNNSFLIPHETYEAASVRISEFYQNTIFHDIDDDDDKPGDQNTTVLTWPPTIPPITGNNSEQLDVPSFLLEHDDSCLQDQIETLASDSRSLSDESLSYTRSRCLAANLSHSIAQFPDFHFNPNTLSPLSSFSSSSSSSIKPVPKKVNLLVAILDVEPRSGTDTVKIKNGADAGKEVAVLRMIVGDEEGRVAKLTAWRDVAQLWGGAESDGVKRGDVILIENVNGLKDAQTSPALTASQYLNSKLTICYRTLPREDGDQRWRPDLRLGVTDAAVRKVAGVVRWFENMAGL